MTLLVRLSLFAVLLSTAVTGVAHADDPARAAASAYYSKGLELANQGRYEAALDQFANAYTKSPHFAVLYNIGQAQIALGRPLEAIAALSKYLRDGAEQVPLSRREQVQAQVALLESRLSELTVTTDTPGAVIRVDGHEVGTAPLFQPISLAAGSHTVTARLPNGAEVVRAVVMGEAERQKLDLELAGAAPPQLPGPAPAPGLPVAALPALESSAPGHVNEIEPTRGPAMRRTSYALAGSGVLAGAAALTVYLAYRGKYQDWKAGGAKVRYLMAGSPEYYDQLRTNNGLAASLTSANHAILGLSIAGGALVAAGTVLFVIDRQARQAGTPIVGWNQGTATIGWSASW